MNDTLDDTYSCLDKNMSQHDISPEYWRVSHRLQPIGVATGFVILMYFTIGVPSNIVIITGVLLQKLYTQPTHLLLLSLACADLLLCLIVMPLIIISGFAGEFILGSSDNARCKVCQTGVSIVALVMFSLHILALISIDRFVFVKYPLRYNKVITQKVVLSSLAIVLILSLSLGALPLLGVGDIYFDHKTFSCSPRFDHKTEVTENIHYLAIILAEATIPLAVLFVTNSWVICIAQKHIREIYNSRNNIKSESERKAYFLNLRERINQHQFQKQLKLFRVFSILFISHMIVWIPLIVRIIEASAIGSDNFSLGSNFILITSIMSHPVLHPLIEACFLPTTRQWFTIVCRTCCKNSKPTNNNSNCCHCPDIISAALLPKLDNQQNTHNKDTHTNVTCS